MKHFFTFLCLCLLTFSTQAQPVDETSLNYYLPTDVTYDASVPKPASILGTPVGKWHVRHDQIVMYLKALAEHSDRIVFMPYARSYEDRQLFVLAITSPQNHANLEALRVAHVERTTRLANSDELQDAPTVVYQGYSVHGDEPSGSNAALLYAYYLAAAQGSKIDQQLNENIILLDPSFNPDGLNRFAHWANTNKSKTPSADPQTREHNQAWPRGRTNHYQFDLNRDWLPVQHPESRGRINLFHQWKPNILTDHHEMGTNATYFFQPGITSRTNPITPLENQDITNSIAKFHAKALDKLGSFYYTKESFDDFYYGKGSTYPDANGCIGILFEQASSRGHVQESINGTLTFPFTIRNQFTTSLSTLEAATEMRTSLLEYQSRFYEDARKEASSSKVKGIVFGDPYDHNRTKAMLNIIQQHQIQVHKLKQQISVDGNTFKPEDSYVIPMQQDQHRFIKALFQQRTEFPDSLFYDVSAWTLPLAFNIPFAALEGKNYSSNLLGDDSQVKSTKRYPVKSSEYAYVFRWDDYYAPRLLNLLLKQNVRAKVATKKFEVSTTEGPMQFEPGSILIPLQKQGINRDYLLQILQREAQRNGIPIHAITGGFALSGVDLGSSSFSALKNPKALLLAGSGTNAYTMGEVWHLLDHRFDIEVSIAEVDRFSRLDLDRYNTLLMCSGSYGAISKSGVEKLKRWVNAGGTIVAEGRAIDWLHRNALAEMPRKAKTAAEKKAEKIVVPKPYASRNNTEGAQVIGGAIFETRLDLTHPLTYGLHRTSFPVFKRGTSVYANPTNAYSSPVRYTAEPLLSGYTSSKHLERMASTPAVVVSGSGRGKVICLVDNMNFRGFWYGTNRLYLNALFFGHVIDNGSKERIKPRKKAAGTK